MENIEAIRIKHALMDWENEKKFREKVLKDPEASAKEKEFAKKRIAEADYYIKKINEDFVAVMDDGWNAEIRQAVSHAKKVAAKTKAGTKVTERDDDFGVWMFQHGKGKEVAKRAEEFKKELKEGAKMKAEIDCGGMKEIKILEPKRETETAKKSARTPNERPKKMKDGTIEWAGKTFKTKKEFDDYILKNTLFIDGER